MICQSSLILNGQLLDPRGQQFDRSLIHDRRGQLRHLTGASYRHSVKQDRPRRVARCDEQRVLDAEGVMHRLGADQLGCLIADVKLEINLRIASASAGVTDGAIGVQIGSRSSVQVGHLVIRIDQTRVLLVCQWP